MDIDLDAVPPVRVSAAVHRVLNSLHAPELDVGQVWRTEFAGWSAHAVIRHHSVDRVVVSPVDDGGTATAQLFGRDVRWAPAVRVPLPRYALDVLLGETRAEPDASVAGELSPRHPLAVVVGELESEEPATEGLAAFLDRHGVSLQRAAQLLGLGGSGVLALRRDRYLPADAEIELLAEETRVPADQVRAAAPTVPPSLARTLRQPSVRQRLRGLAARLQAPFDTRFVVARQAMVAGQRTTGPGDEDWGQIVDDVLTTMESSSDTD